MDHNQLGMGIAWHSGQPTSLLLLLQRALFAVWGLRGPVCERSCRSKGGCS